MKISRTVFKIEKMDCPSEEQIIRLKLEDIKEIRKLDFTIPERLLTVYHEESALPIIAKKLDELDFNSHLLESQGVMDSKIFSRTESVEKKILFTVMAINFAFFIIEMAGGLLSGSMGLAADSLDMFADASVYGLSLYVVGKRMYKKKQIAKLSGYIQLTLALLGFSEVIRRFSGFENVPDFKTMIIVSVLALIANLVCLHLLQRAKSDEAHMQASMIFTSNDIIVNTGVIAAGIFVSILHSNIPDLIIGAIVFSFVIRGAFRILKLAK